MQDKINIKKILALQLSILCIKTDLRTFFLLKTRIIKSTIMLYQVLKIVFIFLKLTRKQKTTRKKNHQEKCNKQNTSLTFKKIITGKKKKYVQLNKMGCSENNW